MSREGIKIITKNRKAYHDYHIEDSYEAGIVLMGSEIKSIRDNKININEGFVQQRDGEMWLMGVHISPYDEASIFGHTDPMRPRKLLLHKREIDELSRRIRERGYTVVPTMLYLKKGRAKVEIALAKGKKLYDKRESIAKRENDRQLRRILKNEY
jgi:SsrA-binding protein